MSRAPRRRPGRPRALAAWRAELASCRRSPWLASLLLRRAREIARRARALHARLAALPRRTRRRLARRWGLALPLLALAMAQGGGTAAAATIPVGEGCALVDAVRSANEDAGVGGCAPGGGADTIVLRGGTYGYAEATDRAEGPTALPAITSQVTIEGRGATIERVAEAEEPFRLMRVAASGDLTVSDLTLRGGQSFVGGAILSQGEEARLTIQGSELLGNGADYRGGAVYNRYGRLVLDDTIVGASSSGDGVWNYRGDAEIRRSMIRENVGIGVMNYLGTLELADSTIADHGDAISGAGLFNAGGEARVEGSRFLRNRARRVGGAILNFDVGELTLDRSILSDNSAGVGGGGLWNEGRARVTRTEIEGNEAGVGGGVASGFEPSDLQGTLRLRTGLLRRGTQDEPPLTSLTLVESTVVDNGARSTGGGLANGYGAMRLLNSTLSGNHAGERGGGIANESEVPAYDGPHLELRHVTIHGNAAPSGAALWTDEHARSALFASVLSADEGLACAGEGGLGGGGNLGAGPAIGACAGIVDGIATGLDPRLADNGGPTRTHALLPGSSAIDTAADCLDLEGAPLAADQRGAARPQDGDGDGDAACDVGAYERVRLGHRIFLPAGLRP